MEKILSALIVNHVILPAGKILAALSCFILALFVCCILNSLLSFNVSLQNAAKQAAAAATQTIAAAQNAASSNKNQAAQQQLVQSCKVNHSYNTSHALKVTFNSNFYD